MLLNVRNRVEILEILNLARYFHHRNAQITNFIILLAVVKHHRQQLTNESMTPK